MIPIVSNIISSSLVSSARSANSSTSHGHEKEYSINIKLAISNLRQLGIMVKKVTFLLLPTRERVVVSTQVMEGLVCQCWHCSV